MKHINIAFIRHQKSARYSINTRNSKFYVDLLKRACINADIDASIDCISYAKDKYLFDKTYQYARHDYDLIVFSLVRRYDTEEIHSGFIAMNDFIKQNDCPVLMFAEDSTASSYPASNMSSWKNASICLCMKDGMIESLSKAGYVNFDTYTTQDISSIFFNENEPIQIRDKDIDFLYIGMKRKDRVLSILNSLKALKDAGFSVAWAGASISFDSSDSLDKEIFDSGIQLLPPVESSGVISAMSRSVFGLVPQDINLVNLTSARLFEYEKAKTIILTDEKNKPPYWLSDDNQYSNVDDLVIKAKRFRDDDRYRRDVMLRQTSLGEQEFTLSRKRIENLTKDAICNLLTREKNRHA